MGRRSKEHVELTEKRVLQFLMDRNDTRLKLDALSSLLDSVLKTKNNSERRKKYHSQLLNAHKVLCVESTDLLELRTKHNDLKTKNNKITEEKCLLRDMNSELQRQVKKIPLLEARSSAHRIARLSAENDLQETVGENAVLLSRIEKLRNQIRALTVNS